ncbi:hypothetical protein DH86_00001503 [Scytalidium sp. 3C]|nr:hypothetical protein DH86_00001503 [Scytalidium sp. 3C]
MRILWAPIGLMIIFWIFVPESPWFHARRGNREKALKAMKQLYGGVKGYDFEEEYGIMARTIEHEREMLQDRPKYIHIFKGLNLKRTLTVMILAVSQQLAGLAIISTYSTYFFSLAGLSDPFLGTVILSCCNLLAVILWSFSTDRFGRRIIINTCQTLVCVILFVVGGLYWTGATTGNAAAGTALTGPVTFFTNSVMGIATCRSAAEIDELYERKIPAWRWSKTVTVAEEQMHVVVQVKGGVKQVHEHRDA